MSNTNRYIALAAGAVLLATGIAHARDMSSAAQIEAAMADRTLQGSMTSDVFAEYYAADGTIKGDGYSGKWRMKDDTMCFDYGDGENCWELEINGPAVTLYKDGEVDGTGMLVEGNPNDF